MADGIILTGADYGEGLIGGAGNDTLLGGGGNDTIEGRDGDDLLDGGADIDTAYYARATAGVTVSLAVAGPQVTGGAGTDTLISIENIIGSAFNDRLTGDAGANLLSAGGGADTLIGGAGDDTLRGGLGDDVLDGGDGFDEVSFSDAAAGVTVSLAATGPQVTGGAGTDTLTGFEAITGSGAADTLTGDNGANRLSGGDGADTLRGGSGDDTLDGGQGADSIDGGDGFDWVDYGQLNQHGSIIIDLSLTGAQSYAGENDRLVNVEGVIGGGYGDQIRAGASSAKLLGGGGDDALYGGAGDDLLDGGDGNDALYAGAGADTVIGGAGTDTLHIVAGATALNLDFSSLWASGQFTGGGLTITGIEALGSVTGSSLNDKVIVGDAYTGAATLSGGAGDDTLTGGAGRDSLFGGDGDDVLAGGAGNDTLTGFTGSDSLLGGAGDDTLSADVTDKLVDGGAGFDTLTLESYDGVTRAMDIDLTGLWAGGSGFANGLEIKGVEKIANLVGSGLADRVVYGDGPADGTGLIAQLGAGDDYASGGLGSDGLSGGGGDDALYGGLGNDSLFGDDGADKLYGGAGNDYITGGEGIDQLYGGDGNDTFNAGANDAIDGGAGRDLLRFNPNIGQAGWNIDLRALWTGGAGTINGGAVINVEDAYDVNGTSNADTIIIGDGLVTQIVYRWGETPGRDAWDGMLLHGYDGDDTIVGSGGADKIYGDRGADKISGGAGDDVVIFDGRDSVDGGAGYDILSLGDEYRRSGEALDLDLRGNWDGTAGASITGIEKFTGGYGSDYSDRIIVGDKYTVGLAIGAGSGDDTVVGGGGNDSITGFDGNDQLSGGAGDDLLTGYFGNDTLDGGSGEDTATFYGNSSDYSWATNADGSLTVRDLRDPTQYAYAYSGVDTLRGVEVLRFSDKSVTLASKAGLTLTGTSGADLLTGAEFDDSLTGGAGDDTLVGGLGDDLLDGGDGFDIASFAGALGPITAYLHLDSQTTGAGIDRFVSIEGLIGGAFNDTFYASNFPSSLLKGGGGDDALNGGIGVDTLDGGAGDDWIYGGGGNDSIDGGDGQDTVEYQGNAANYSWTATADGGWIVNALSNLYDSGTDLVRNVEVLKFADKSVVLSTKGQTITGTSGADVLTGGSLSDSIEGGAGNDTLSGGAGDDTLVGGAGDDVLNGGAGFDFVSFANATGPIEFSTGDWAQNTGDGTDTWTSIEGVIGSAFNDRFFGGFGSEILMGGGGDDFFQISAGDDTIDGGDGVDTVSLFNNSTDYVWSRAADGSLIITEVTGNAQIGVDTLRNVEYLKFSNATIKLNASGAIEGTSGDDFLYGSAGNDRMSGGAGRDFFTTSAGDDTFEGGDGLDYVWFEGAPGKVTIDLSISGPQNTGDGLDTFIGIEGAGGGRFNDTLSGSANGDMLGGGDGDDLLFGRAGDDLLDGSRHNDTIYGGAGNDTIRGGSENDTLYGDEGDDRFVYYSENSAWEPGEDIFDGGAGVDTLQTIYMKSGLTIDLNLTGRQQISSGLWMTVTNIENLEGAEFGDKLTGNAADNVLTGNGGNDTIDGGAGIDTVYMRWTAGTYTVTWTVNGWLIEDKQAKNDTGPNTDGVDLVRNVEKIVFGYGNPAQTLGDGMTLVAGNLLRSNLANVATLTNSLSARLAANTIDATQALKEIIVSAGATTSVASLAYQFFTGKVPGSGGIDYLVSPTGPNANNLNSAYYQSFNLENRYINFAVNLGKVGEGNAKFTVEYGSLSLFDATRKAYTAIFGGTPTDAKVTALLAGGRDAYFATYGGDGLNGIGTKAAMVGWLLAEAQKADLGVMVRSNDAWLADLADGSAPYAIDLLDPSKGYYKTDFIFGGA